MPITAREFVDNMGAGWNLGNTFECYIDNGNNRMEFANYYGLALKIKYGSTTTFLTSKTIKSTDFSFDITLPSITTNENIYLSLVLTNNYLVKTDDSPVITTNTFLVGDKTLTNYIGEIVFPPVNKSESVVNIDITSLYLNGAKISLKGKITTLPLSTDENAKTRLANLTPTSWGTPPLTFAMLDAVKSAGFKTIRFPITWTNHFDKYTYEIDQEWFNLLKKYIDYCVYELDLNVLMNMHHDDGDSQWLFTDAFITDTEMQNKYKTIWTQIAIEFADYPQEKLVFAGYNETRGTDHSWDTTNSDNLYGIQLIGEAFYETVRAIEGNENRLLMFPSYAAKVTMIGGNYTEANGNVRHFGLPENDDYCIAEIHIYEKGYTVIRKYIDYAASTGMPMIIGEFGINASEMTTASATQSQQYMMAYARYKGLGAVIWDDYGGMGILKRGSVKSTNYTSKDVWNGNLLEFVPRLVASAEIKEVDIDTDTRLTELITGDELTFYLDSNYNCVWHIEDGEDCGSITNNVFLGGLAGSATIVGISEVGEYNKATVNISDPTHFVINDYTLNLENISIGEYNRYSVDYGLVTGTTGLHFNDLIPVSPSTTFKVNCSDKIRLYCIEYNSSKKLAKKAEEIKALYNGNTQVFSSNTAYIGINIAGYSEGDSTQYVGYSITERDYDYIEHPVEDRNIVFSDFTQYKLGVYRTIDVLGGIEYTCDFGYQDIDINIKELGKDGVEKSSALYKNGDSFKTQPFTKYLTVEIYPRNLEYNDLVNLFSSKGIVPTLNYNNYTIIEDIFEDETCPKLDIDDNSSISPIPDGTKFYTYNGKLIKYNGKFIK